MLVSLYYKIDWKHKNGQTDGRTDERHAPIKQMRSIMRAGKVKSMPVIRISLADCTFRLQHAALLWTVRITDTEIIQTYYVR